MYLAGDRTIKETTIPHFVTTPDFERYLPTAPILSSKETGWESVMVRAYHEPSILEETLFPGGPDIYLVLVTSGHVEASERKIGGPWITYDIRANDWYLTPAGGEPYALRWKCLSDEPLKTLHLHLNAHLFAEAVQQIVDRDPAQVAIVERSGLQDPLLTHIGLSLQQELQHPATDLGQFYAATAAQMLAAHLLRHYTTANTRIREYSNKLSSHQLRRISAFIHTHLDQNLSLEMLARHIGFSSYHFARLFRQTTGESPHQFVLDQRLTVAQRLLTDTDLPLADVALRVGIPNQSHFTQVFKRRLGITPHAYRKEH